MSETLLHILDIFFVVFHSMLILFVLFGWIPRPLRLLHLIVVLLTGASWFILGLFYGIGYCPLTDWHWNVLSQLGETELPVAYVQYILYRLLRIRITPAFSDIITLLGWAGALLTAIYLQYKKLQKRKKK